MYAGCGLLIAVPMSIGIGVYLTSTNARPADLRYVNPSGIHTLDPARMSWTPDFRVALNIWEGLTTWDPQALAPIPAAAAGPPRLSNDGLTLTFRIRDDANWSNGEPVTARDFVRGWRRGMEPGTATDYTFLFTEHVAGAAEYVRWRREGVRALTALRRRAEGWSVGDEPTGVSLATSHSALSPSSAEATATDWEQAYERRFITHAESMEVMFDGVGVSAVDQKTLRVHLARPCPYFLDLAALPIFLPCHQSIELLRKRYRGAPITAEGLVVYDPQWTKPDYRENGYPGLITNGPYTVEDWTFKRRLRMRVNPCHRLADTMPCRTVDMLVHQNISAALMAYEAGDVDFLPAMDVPYDHEIARLSRTGARPDFHLCRVAATYFLNFNCVSETVAGQPNPFVDARVRRAFALAIDKTQIVDQVLARGDRVATSFVPPDTIRGYRPPAGLVADPPRARALLEEAGFPGGVGLPPIELLYTPSDERICQALGRMWQESLNVTVALRSMETKTFAEEKANQRFMIARGNWYADYNDPTTFLDCLTTGNGNNDSGYTNPAYDEWLRRANATDDSARRMALLHRAEAIIIEEDLPIMPILHYATPIAIKPYVEGLYPNARLWFPFRYVRVTR